MASQSKISPVTETPAFAAASRTLAQLRADLDAARRRHTTAALALAENRLPGDAARGPIERAQALARGERGGSAAERLDALRAAELAERELIPALEKGISEAAALVERAREAARAATLATHPERTAIEADFRRAAAALRDAMGREDALLAGLVAGGYGCGDAQVTAGPLGIAREIVVEWATAAAA